jgi:hypothetical protein
MAEIPQEMLDLRKRSILDEKFRFKLGLLTFVTDSERIAEKKDNRINVALLTDGRHKLARGGLQVKPSRPE